MTDRRGFLQLSVLAAGSLAIPELRAPARGLDHDRACLVGVHINPEMRVKVARGPARAELVVGGWRAFLVKVHNEAGTTAALRATASGGWVEVEMVDRTPLSGQALEYRGVRLYSREAGRREVSLMFDVGQGTQDLGFRNEVPVLFVCHPERSSG